MPAPCSDDFRQKALAAVDRKEDKTKNCRTFGISRNTMIAGWCDREILAPMTFQGSCNTALVEAWVEQYLVPELQPGQVVVMDNASFHKSGTIWELIEAAGYQLLFLPPYSPDLNKIEKFWLG